MNTTNYLDELVMLAIFNATAFPLPATLAVALFTAAPTKAGGGTEVSGGAYARVEVAPDAANWNVSGGDPFVTLNLNPIDFGTATGAAWGTIVALGLFDATSGGNLLFFGSLTQAKSVADGDPVIVNAGNLQVAGG